MVCFVSDVCVVGEIWFTVMILLAFWFFCWFLLETYNILLPWPLSCACAFMILKCQDSWLDDMNCYEVKYGSFAPISLYAHFALQCMLSFSNHIEFNTLYNWLGRSRFSSIRLLANYLVLHPLIRTPFYRLILLVTMLCPSDRLFLRYGTYPRNEYPTTAIRRNM